MVKSHAHFHRLCLFFKAILFFISSGAVDDSTFLYVPYAHSTVRYLVASRNLEFVSYETKGLPRLQPYYGLYSTHLLL